MPLSPFLRTGSARLCSATRASSASMFTPTTKVFGEEIKFGPFSVTNQVFLKTQYSYALVNLKPIIPGHILVSPLKPHRRLTDLDLTETSDLFTTVQLAQRLLGAVYFPESKVEAGSFTIAVQDGPESGQTVPHVHVHVIPRTKGDLPRPDDIYLGLAGEESNVGGALWDKMKRPVPGGGMPRIEDDDRTTRTKEEMNEEAEKYRAKLKEMGIE